jgi:hypothetical protein
MKKTILFLSIATFVSTTSAFAATEFWVAKSAATKKCEVVAAKPDGKTMMEIGKAAYKTKAEAETAMKAAADCK